MNSKSLAVQQAFWTMVACMIHSEDISASSFPWVAGIVNNRGITQCSGCIVAKRMVLTSSMCLVKQMEKTRNVEKRIIVIAPADDPIVLRVALITLLHPESEANKSLEHVGLLGVDPAFEERPDLKYIAPIWDKRDGSLHQAYRYIVKNAHTIQCYIVSWPYKGIGKVIRKYDKIVGKDYQIDVVHIVPAHPLLEDKCIEHFVTAGNAIRVPAYASTCALMLNTGARMCDYDRGAGLICANYLWGIAVGDHSCAKNDSLHEFIRIDAASDFITNQSNHAFTPVPGACQVAESYFRIVTLGPLIASFGTWLH